MDDQTGEQTPITKEQAESLQTALQATPPVLPPPLDPYVLFTQIEGMRKEGVSEETIRIAFNQLMEERSGNYRKAPNSMKRTKDSVPMPTQEEINKMYAGAQIDKVVSPEMELILEELENGKARKAAYRPPSLRAFRDNLARKLMVGILRLTIWVFKTIGVK